MSQPGKWMINQLFIPKYTIKMIFAFLWIRSVVGILSPDNDYSIEVTHQSDN